MKTLIKIIVILFFFTLGIAYYYIPLVKVLELYPDDVPGCIIWLITSYMVIGYIIMFVPIIYIIKWINKNVKL